MGSKFVKIDKEAKRWYFVPDDESRTKIGHAIRDLHKSMENQLIKAHNKTLQRQKVLHKSLHKPRRSVPKMMMSSKSVPLPPTLRLPIHAPPRPMPVPKAVPVSNELTAAQDAIIGLLVLGRRVR